MASSSPGNGNGNKPVLVVKKPRINNDTYGLDLQYLNSLGLIPPLQSRITEYNVDPKLDHAKIREIFGLAGRIVDIHRLRKNDGTIKPSVKIEYDHPVEAVQAISMFRNQKLFNKTLSMKMENSAFPYKRPIPAGLSRIGPGLGENGEPLPYVRAHVELQSLKGLIHNLASAQERKTKLPHVPPPTLAPNPNLPLSLLNDLIKLCQWNTGQMIGHTQSDPTANIPQQAQGFMEQNTNYFNASNPATLQNTTSMAPNVGNWKLQGKAGSNQPKQKQDCNEPNQYVNHYGQSTPNSNNESYKRNDACNFIDTRNVDDDNFRNKCGDIIVFKNLPSSVTVEALRVKMNEVGELRGAELTGLGRPWYASNANETR